MQHKTVVYSAVLLTIPYNNFTQLRTMPLFGDVLWENWQYQILERTVSKISGHTVRPSFSTRLKGFWKITIYAYKSYVRYTHLKMTYIKHAYVSKLTFLNSYQ